jgi:hypothetical protein
LYSPLLRFLRLLAAVNSRSGAPLLLRVEETSREKAQEAQKSRRRGSHTTTGTEQTFPCSGAVFFSAVVCTRRAKQHIHCVEFDDIERQIVAMSAR